MSRNTIQIQAKYAKLGMKINYKHAYNSCMNYFILFIWFNTIASTSVYIASNGMNNEIEKFLS
jgi:hypothetical protein